MKKSTIALLVVIVLLVLDQALKIYVKTTFPLGEGFDMLGLSWAKISFVENEGMAFGMTFGGMWGKLILSIFRIFAIGGIFWLLWSWIKKDFGWIPVIGLSMILSGAVGNAIDGIFYGVIFSESDYSTVATMFPAKGYAPFLWGKVVDMFWFPMIDTTWPQWVPVVGGHELRFFSYIFNLADASIFVGCVGLFASYKKLDLNS